jgi:hypothetical protein
MTEVDMGGLVPPGMEAEREFARRVGAVVHERVHRLEDVGPVAKWLLDEGVEPEAAAELLFGAFSEQRLYDLLGCGYGECRRAIWAAVGRGPRKWDWPEILASWQR